MCLQRFIPFSGFLLLVSKQTHSFILPDSQQPTGVKEKTPLQKSFFELTCSGVFLL